MIADGMPCVYVAGNHEVAAAANDPVMASAASVVAAEYGVTWLENTAAEIGGVRFAGATLWEHGDLRHQPSVEALQGADVIVTRYPPVPSFSFKVLPEGGLWISGHHHGPRDITVAEPIAWPGIADLVIEWP
jgi:hypothetical protein